MTNNLSLKCLIIGYGNTNRKDDGAGIITVELLQHEGKVEADFLIEQELGLELIEAVSAYDKVIFVDASVGEEIPEIHFEEIKTDGRGSTLTHLLGPATILDFSKKLYGRCPVGYLVSIRGYDFDFGTELSPKTSKLITIATELIIELVAETLEPYLNARTISGSESN